LDPSKLLYYTLDNLDESLLIRFRQRAETFLVTEPKDVINKITISDLLDCGTGNSQVIIAGGALMTLLSDRDLDTCDDEEDIDFWICGDTPDCRLSTFKSVVSILESGMKEDSGKIPITLKNNAFTFSVPGYRKIQVVMTSESEPDAIPRSFDLDFTKGWFGKDGLHLSIPLLLALNDDEIYIEPENMYVHRLLKVVRYPNFNDAIDLILEVMCRIATDDSIFMHRTKVESCSYPETGFYPITRVTLLDLRDRLKFSLPDLLSLPMDNYNVKSQTLAEIIRSGLDDVAEILSPTPSIKVEDPVRICQYENLMSEDGVCLNDLILSRKYISKINSIAFKDRLSSIPITVHDIDRWSNDHAVYRTSISQRVVLNLEQVSFKLNITRGSPNENGLYLTLPSDHPDTEWIDALDKAWDRDTIMKSFSNSRYRSCYVTSISTLIYKGYQIQTVKQIKARFSDANLNRLLKDLSDRDYVISGNDDCWEMSGIGDVSLRLRGWSYACGMIVPWIEVISVTGITLSEP
jgi:hypothetical protein